MAIKKLGLIAKKSGMTTLFDSNGIASAVTVLEVPKNYVIQVKDIKNDGYYAVQIGAGETKENRVTKPLLGHFKKHNVVPLKKLVEFRLEEQPTHKSGEILGVSILKDYKYLDVTGTSKGRGFTGMVKRWNKVMGPRTHGSMNVRQIGSVGSNTFPGRIRKGKKMPGHYGNERVTIKNLEVFEIDEQNNLIIVKGAVPGPAGGWVIVKPSYKNFITKSIPKTEEKVKK